jgi:hypothetical protein
MTAVVSPFDAEFLWQQCMLNLFAYHGNFHAKESQILKFLHMTAEASILYRWLNMEHIP